MHLIKLIKLVIRLLKLNNQNKNLICNSQHSFAKFKDIVYFKGLSYTSMCKKLKHFHKKFTDLKNVIPQAEANKDLKESFGRCWGSF